METQLIFVCFSPLDTNYNRNKMKIFLALIMAGIISCNATKTVIEVDAGMDAGENICPQETNPGCSHCGDVIVDISKVDQLCQNFNGLSGGVPSEWLYETFSTCVCTGDCSDLCQSACIPSKVQYTVDITAVSLQCDICIQTQAHSSVDPHGCGAQLSLCESDLSN